MYVTKEATLREVMAQVSMADLGGQLATAFKGLGCLVIWFAGTALIGSVAGNALPATDFHVPTVVWIGIGVGIFVAVSACEKSYHELHYAYWFPKLRFFGWLMVTVYITGTIEGFRLANVLPYNTAERWLSVAALWIFLIIPGALFWDLCQLGHGRLIHKRTTNASDGMAHEVT